MGVKFAKAFGAEVVLFTTSPNKIEDDVVSAHRKLSSAKMRRRWRTITGTFDFILDCVSADHDVNAYLNLLKRDGTLCLVGARKSLSR